MMDFFLNPPADTGPTFECSVLPHYRSMDPVNLSWTWAQIVSTSGLGAIYKALGPTKQQAKDSLPMFSPAAYNGTRTRGGAALKSIQILPLDFDSGGSLEEIHNHLVRKNITHFGHHSISSTPDLERFHIFIPLTTPHTGVEWKDSVQQALRELCMNKWDRLVDPHTPYRGFFPPAYWTQEPETLKHMKFFTHNGESLNLQALQNQIFN